MKKAVMRSCWSDRLSKMATTSVKSSKTTSPVVIRCQRKNTGFHNTLSTNWIPNSMSHDFRVSTRAVTRAINTENKIMMENQAAPNTHPGGVQGALSSCWYHTLVAGLRINKLPRPSAPKLITRKRRVRSHISLETTERRICAAFFVTNWNKSL